MAAYRMLPPVGPMRPLPSTATGRPPGFLRPFGRNSALDRLLKKITLMLVMELIERTPASRPWIPPPRHEAQRSHCPPYPPSLHTPCLLIALSDGTRVHISAAHFLRRQEKPQPCGSTCGRVGKALNCRIMSRRSKSGRSAGPGNCSRRWRSATVETRHGLGCRVQPSYRRGWKTSALIRRNPTAIKPSAMMALSSP
jgi:hypothetical protein